MDNPRFHQNPVSFFIIAFLGLVLLAGIRCSAPASPAAKLKFAVTLPAEGTPGPLDGRVMLLISKNGEGEPRFQISDNEKTQLIFGVDVDGLAPGRAAVIDAAAFGYPLPSIAEIPAGEYYVQALLNVYETFHRADGRMVKLPIDQGEGQHWNTKPGNRYSAPRKIALDPKKSETIALALDKVIPPLPRPKDTKYIRHERIQSKLLSDFWGRPMEIGACVLLPEGFDTNPQAHYPLIIYHGHFPATFEGFREEPPDPNLKPDYSERFHVAGYNRTQEEYAYQFFKDWTGPNFPRAIVIEIQHANPYYDDSYAVNSANLGPYGDAIVRELIPAVEKKYRGLGQGWARFTYGGSTGGWEALAVQVFYPEEFNGCFAACPDPIDFHAYTNIDLYGDKNAFYLEGAHKREAQPAMRDYLGHPFITTQEINGYELALGDHGRSGEQYDIWQAVYGPVGADGYPQPIFDKVTGDIDHTVAEYWRRHYDLEAILERDWSKLGPELAGKIHIYVGSDDTYFLNDAVYRMEDFLNSTANPPYGGEVTYGPRAEHCWNGDPTQPNAYSRLHYNTQYLPKILDRIQKTAPKGADLTSWRY